MRESRRNFKCSVECCRPIDRNGIPWILQSNVQQLPICGIKLPRVFVEAVDIHLNHHGLSPAYEEFVVHGNIISRIQQELFAYKSLSNALVGLLPAFPVIVCTKAACKTPIRSGARTPKLAATSAHGNWCDFDGDHGRKRWPASDSVFSSNFGRVWPGCGSCRSSGLSKRTPETGFRDNRPSGEDFVTPAGPSGGRWGRSVPQETVGCCVKPNIRSVPMSVSRRGGRPGGRSLSRAVARMSRGVEEAELRVERARLSGRRHREDGASADRASWFRVAATPRTIMTSLGPLTYRRARYRSGASGSCRSTRAWVSSTIT